jgi:hypothetical protein
LFVQHFDTGKIGAVDGRGPQDQDAGKAEPGILETPKTTHCAQLEAFR